MARIILTPSLVYASGRDAGNAAMGEAGRTEWNEDDYNTACEVANKFLHHIYQQIPERQ